MSQPLRKFTEGNRRRYIVDYSQYLRQGATVSSFAAVSSSDTATIDDVSVNGDGQGVFFIEGGELDEEFTVTITMVSSYTEIKIDDLPFVVIAP